MSGYEHSLGLRHAAWPILATVLLLASAAQGMYDPHHGRWFQRDPLGVRPEEPPGEFRPALRHPSARITRPASIR